MKVTYRVHVDEELFSNLHQSIKVAFEGKKIDITVTDIDSREMDEIEYPAISSCKSNQSDT